MVRHSSLTGLSVWILVTGLFVRRWCVVGLLLVRLFVSRLQLVCCSSNADLSVRVRVASPAALFAPGPSDRPSLLCVFVRCLSGTGPSLVRVVDPSLVFLLESSLSYRCLVARPLGSTRLHWALCSLGFGCSVLHSARHGCSVLHSARHGCSVLHSARHGCSVLHSAASLDSPCIPIPILLVAFGRHAVHTHSVPRVVSRYCVITHSLFLGL